VLDACEKVSADKKTWWLACKCQLVVVLRAVVLTTRHVQPTTQGESELYDEQAAQAEAAAAVAAAAAGADACARSPGGHGDDGPDDADLTTDDEDDDDDEWEGLPITEV
jgi:hypothetical protein